MTIRESRLFVPTIAASTVFISGFGALNILYALLASSTPKPGLYDYYASSYGDGILLPLAAFLVEWALLNRKPQLVSNIVGAAIGLTLGIILQTLWLLDPDPGVNWTLISPGQFNVAGWYHAAFLTGTLSYFTARTTTLIVTLFHIPNHYSILWPTVSYFITIALFAFLLLIDNSTSDERTLASSSTTSSIAVLSTTGIIAIISLVSFRARARHQQKTRRTMRSK